MRGLITRDVLQLWTAIETERRRRANERDEFPRWDWYGPDCGCPVGERRKDGSCPQHPRARPNQRPPEWDWHLWMILTGRGWGKTRTGAQWAIDCSNKLGKAGRGALIGQTASDVRDVMVEGESGILRGSPPWFTPHYEPSKRRLTWPNGAQAFCYSSEEPGYFRGPQFHWFWADELAKWSYLEECYDNLQFGLRLGVNEGWTPRGCVTTTPLPLPLIKQLKRDSRTAFVTGSTYENEANLAESAVEGLRRKYEGTRLGDQELHGKILEDNPGALWTMKVIEPYRVTRDQVPELVRLVVPIDPSVADPTKLNRRNEDNLAEAGIVPVALGEDEHFYVLEDCTVKGSPVVWGRASVNAYHRLMADLIVAEVNNGGALIEALIRTVDEFVSYKEVHASRGKAIRAEPIASLYEQGRVHHVGRLEGLEDEMTSWVPNSGMASPNRVDSLVWGLTELSQGGVPLRVSKNPFGNWRG